LAGWRKCETQAPVIENLIEDLAHSLGHWAYLMIALIAMAETAAFLGFVAPGEFTVILGGVLAGEGSLSIQLLIGIVWAAAVIGDSIGFYLGHHYGRSLFLRFGPKVRLEARRLEQVEGYFRRHGGKTIFIGRWVGFVRPLMPFTAGTSRLPYRRFLPYDILSAGLWSATLCLLGYIFWRNFSTLTSIAGKGALGLGIVVAIVVGAIFAFKRLRKPEERERLAAFMRRLGRRRAVGPFAIVLRALWLAVLRPLWRYVLAPVWRVVFPFLRFLGHRLTPGEFGLEFTTLVAIAAVSGFVFIAYTDVISSSPALITPGDDFSADLARDIEGGFLTAIAKAITLLGKLGVGIALVGMTALALIAARRWVEAAVLAVGFAAGQIAVHITKAAVDRPRPSGGLIEVSGSSFPSGHAQIAIAYVAVAIVAARSVKHASARVALVTGAIVLAVLIGLSRVYLRVHYLSDVTSGWALGLLAFALFGSVALFISYLRHNGRARERSPAQAIGVPGDG
jgi:membrane protein DedA with SNARE-associated domain/membrane-associated phospholipid phosphatase